MEYHEGILSKSPDYVKEKFNRYAGKENNIWKYGLNINNTEKFNKYLELWEKK